MAQDKRVFTGGMDKDSEPRLIKQGDYRDAKNIRNVASSDGTSGSVENIEGTQEVNYNFIDESETIVELIDEEVIEEPPVPQIHYYQDIILTGRQNAGAYYAVNQIRNTFVSPGNPNLISLAYWPTGIFPTWSDGDFEAEFIYTDTAAAIYANFNPENGLHSQNIPLVHFDTGTEMTGHSEVYYINSYTYNDSLDYIPLTPNVQMNGTATIIVRIIADQPNLDFKLDFWSTANQVGTAGGALWSNTVDDFPPYGQLNIQQTEDPIIPAINIGSLNSFILVDGGFGVAPIDPEDGGPIGVDNPFSGEGAITEVQMTITGINPITPQDPQNEFKIFSVVENGNGTVEAIPFAQNVFNQFESDFNSGDPFEFDGDMTEIAASLHDKLSVPFSTQILVPGSTSASTHTISTLNNNVATSFGVNTQLGVVRSPNLSATASASDFYVLESYNSLSSFSSYRNSGLNFIDANSSVSILNDSITIENPVRGSFNREVFFPVPLGGIVKGDVYRIEANISTFSSSGNSITFQTQDGKNVSPAVTSTNSSFSFQFEAQGNNQLFKLIVANDFAEQDTIVMSNVSIRQFRNPETELIVDFRASYTFDLVFSTDAATAISDYLAGTSQRDLAWFDGVNVNLTQTIQYGSNYDNLIEDIGNYDVQINQLEEVISTLQGQLTSVISEYNATIGGLNAASQMDGAEAIGSYNYISSGLTNIESVIENNDETLAGLFQVLESIGDGSYEEGFSEGVASQASIIADLQSQLDEALENAQNTSTTVINALGQNLLTNGDFGDSSGISSFPFTQSLNTGSNGWIHYNDPSNFGSGVNVTAESAAITTTEGSSVLKMARGSVNSIHITAAAAFNNSTESLNITETGKFYRLSFDIVKSISAGFFGSGSEETSELSYYDGTSSWITIGSVSSGDQKIVYYEATGSTFAIRLNENFREVHLDNFSLQEISADSIDDYQDLLTQNEAAQQELSDIQSAVNEVIGSVQPTTLGGVQNLIQAYQQASASANEISNELGGLITLLNNASFSNEEVQGNITEQIAILEEAIQAVVDIDSNISSNSSYSDIAGFVSAAGTVSDDYSVLVDSITELQQTVGGIVTAGQGEGFANPGGYSITSPTVLGDYALYQTQLDAMTGHVQTLLNSLSDLSTANSSLLSDLQSQSSAAADAAAAAQADFDDQLAAANAETQEAVEALAAAQAELDAQYLLGYNDAGVLLNQQLETALTNLNAATATLEGVNPDIAAAQENLTTLINIANDLQSQLETTTPEDGISQADLDAAIANGEEIAETLQLALDAAITNLPLTNLISNGDFANNSIQNVTIFNSSSETTWSVENESLLLSNPGYALNQTMAGSSSYVEMFSSTLTQGNYIFSYDTFGSGAPQVKLREVFEGSNPLIAVGDPIIQGNSVIHNFAFTPSDPSGSTVKVNIYGQSFDGSVDNISLVKLPDNVTLTQTIIDQVNTDYQSIQQLIVQQAVSMANMYTEDDLDVYYNNGFADGAASVDITSDNQAVNDQAYLLGYNEGQLSVNPDNLFTQEQVDVLEDEAYLQGITDAGNNNFDFITQLVSTAMESADYMTDMYTEVSSDIIRLLGLLTNLSNGAQDFTATTVADALGDLSLISTVDQQYINQYNADHTQNVNNINEIITIIQQQLLTLEQNPVQSNNVNEEFSFVLYGDVDLEVDLDGSTNTFNGHGNYANITQGQTIRLLYWNENVINHEIPDESRYIELVPNQGSNFSSGILNSCHLFDNTESHISDGTYSSLGPHDHIRVIGSGTGDASVLKLSIKNFNSDNVFMSSILGPTIADDYEFIDSNNEDLDRGFHFTISVLSGDPSWQFALMNDNNIVSASNISDVSLTHINLVSGSYTEGGNVGVVSETNLLTSTADELIFPLVDDGGFVASSPTNPSNPAWNYSFTEGWRNRTGNIVFDTDVLEKSVTLESNTTYELTWHCWMPIADGRRYSIDLGDTSGGIESSSYNQTSSSLWTPDQNYVYEGDNVKRFEAEPGSNVAVIDSIAPGGQRRARVIITTGPNYSANVIRIYGGSPDPNPATTNDLNKAGGWTGNIKNFAIRKVGGTDSSTTNYNINLLYERTSTSSLRSQLSSPLYNRSRILNGSARRVIKDKLTGVTRERPIVAGGYKCIGSYEDKPKNRVYYFIFNERTAKKYDCILEYDLMTDSIQTVYQDGRSSSDNSPNNILNFSEHHLITGVNKIDDILYFTDNLNRPRKINVELAKQNEKNINNPRFIFKDAYYKSSLETVYIGIGPNSHPFEEGDHIYAQLGAIAGTAATGINGYSEILGVVKKPSAGTTFNVTNGSATVNASTGHNLDDFAGDWIGIQDASSNNFPVYYQISSVAQNTITLTSPYNGGNNTAALPVQFNGENAVGLITNSPWPGAFTPVDGVILYADPYSDIRLTNAYSPLISFGTYEDKMRYFDVVKHQPTHRPTLNLSVDVSFAANNILDNVFQFKYRYVHKDDEQTSYSPISDVAIDPMFALNSAVDAEDYGSIANKITITYDDTIADVKDIEIVARKGNNGEFVLVDTLTNNFIKYLKKVKNSYLPEYQFTDIQSSVKFYNNGTYPFVDKKDSDKLYDVVPKLAKAQTILSNNRLAYGNVLEGYDNTRLIANSGYFFEDGTALEAGTVNILYNGAYEGNIGAGGSSQFTLGGTGNPSTYDPELDFSSINLSPDSQQQLSLSLGFFTQAENWANSEVSRRAGSLVANYNMTGFGDIDSFCNEVVSQINSGNFEGGCAMSTNVGTNASDYYMGYFSNTEAVTASYLGAGVVRILFETSNVNGGGMDGGDFYNFQHQLSSYFTSGNGGLSSFKTGAFHNFGVAYFDETNRCSFVNTAPDYQGITAPGDVPLNGTRPYNKFFTEAAGTPANTPSTVDINIYNRPPRWATNYQFYYTGNTTIDEFIQMMFVGAKIATDSNDKQIYLNMGALKGKDWSYNQANNSQIDYNYVAGDRIRFISFDPGNGRQTFGEYIDLEIAGMDLYIDGEDAPIDVNSETEGFYLRINDPGNSAVLTESGTISIAHSGFSYTSSGYEKLIAEIYRPKKDLDEDLMVYYEIGDKIPIKNPGTSSRTHGGDSPQGESFNFNKEIGDYISDIPATVRLSSGDIYFKPRNMATVTDGSSQEVFFPEDYYLNDFHRTNHYSRGRINVVNNNAAERRLEASVYFSETYSSTGSVNGLSSFNPANSPYFDYNKDFGSIQALKMRDNDLIIFHESKVGRVLVQKDILNTASGEGLVSLSTNVIGNYVNLYKGEYGCCLQPESIVGFGNIFYFIDIKRGAALRLSADGLTVTSDQGMRDYFRDIGEMYVINDPEVSQIENPFSIVAGYDPKYDEYIVTFPNVLDERKNLWGKDFVRWDSSNDKYQNKETQVLYESQTLAFNERTNRWTSFYDFYPDYYGRVGRQFIGFKEGRLYKHNMTDRLYQDLYINNDDYLATKGNSKYNSFYGQQFDSHIEFPFNTEPSSVKSFNAISLEGDAKLFASMYANTGQVIQGDGLENGDKNVIRTSIGYRLVDGDIFNYQDGSGSEPYVRGNGTKFLDNLKKGDVVRIFGSTKDSGSYTFVTRIVLSVVSNTLLLLSENINLELEGNHMEVLDYKTKEGVHYSMIPFVESIINTADRGDLIGYENQGDGSEITGIGFVQGQSFGSNLGEFFGTINNSEYSLNKRITPKEMFVGAEYVLAEQDLQYPFYISSVNYDDKYQNNLPSVGDIFVCHKNTDITYNSKVISTDIKLYIRRPDNKVVLLGYPYFITEEKISFVKNPDYSAQNEAGGFLFVVKNGNVEGEKMKGQYMMTKLTTEHPGPSYLSKYKFNLYAANADIDKSELSNK
jgi:hypothetical protein